jgi:DNA polymerase-3 subunit gamma/tau
VESGHDPRRFAMDLLERLRDLIILAAVPDGAAQVLRNVPHDQLERMVAQQSRFGPGSLSRAADIVNAGITEMTGATSPRLHLELICARLLLPGASGEHGYAARLDRLERRIDAGSAPPAGPALLVTRPVETGVTATEPVDAAEAASPPGPAPEAPTPQATEPADAPEPAAPATLTGGPGDLDLDTLRREWPRVLARIFTVRRVTWTFLSQHAQVVEYDGSRLVLGIATSGLANTFRQGNHAEVVRQALIDALAIDVRVEGRTLKPNESPDLPAPESAVAARDDVPRDDAPPAPPSPPDGGASEGQAPPAPEEEPSPPEDPPDPAAAPDRTEAQPPARPGRPRGRTSARQASAAPPVDPDEVASIDDEDVDSGESGQALIERMLGGQVLDDTVD